MPADFNDGVDFDDADRGLIGSLEPCVIRADDGREIWNNDAWGLLERRLSGHGQPEPVAPVSAHRPTGPLRGNRGHLPDPADSTSRT